jgi:hypothetical protein
MNHGPIASASATGYTWRKSTYSGSDSNCVEVAGAVGRAVAVRDSKDPDGPALAFSARAWETFLAAIKAEQL